MSDARTVLVSLLVLAGGVLLGWLIVGWGQRLARACYEWLITRST